MAWPDNEKLPVLEEYAENLARLIENNDFDELTNYYANISIGFNHNTDSYVDTNIIITHEDVIDLYDVYKLFLLCFGFCAKYDNIKAFRFFYTIFNELDLNNYVEYADEETLYDILTYLIINKQYEMFRYLEPILLNASGLYFNLDYFVCMLVFISIKESNYEIFEYVINNYKLNMTEFEDYIIHTSETYEFILILDVVYELMEKI